MTLPPAVRSGLITGAMLLFLILIGIYTTFEALTLSGMWLTVQGATASEIAKQVPTATNPQFSRVFTLLVALIAGALASRTAKNLSKGILHAITATAIAGAMVAVFLFLVSTLYSNTFDVSFVFEKLKKATIAALLFGQPAIVGGVIWIAFLPLAARWARCC